MRKNIFSQNQHTQKYQEKEFGPRLTEIVNSIGPQRLKSTYPVRPLN